MAGAFRWGLRVQDTLQAPDELRLPAELEQFYIPFPDGDPAARIGLRLDFFFRRSGEADLRERLVACIEHYLALAGDRMILYSVAGDRRYRKLKPGQRVDPGRLRKMIDPKGDFLLQASAAEPGIAQHWATNVMSSQVSFNEEELGYLTAYLPLTALQNAPPRSFTKLFLHFCDRLAVEHAYGGLGWVLPFDPGGRNGALNLPLLAEQAVRFCGLDINDPIGTSLHCEGGIKSINWLTAVSHRLLERVGGAEAAAKAAGPEIIVHPYGNGMVFQAGAMPQIGDRQQGLIPPAYVALGRALKSLRAPYPDTLMYAPPGFGPVAPGEDPDEVFTQQWLARFDGD
ncbi:MAG: type VI immunity family protein [Gammaproteobacteria bacterium]